MKHVKCRVAFILAACLFVGTAFPQDSEEIVPVKLSGFRVGLTYMPGDVLRDALDDPTTFPLLAQFGWQFEKQFPSGMGGLAAIFEVIPMVGGMNLGILIPSVSMLIGIRTQQGYELGAGPQISLSGSKDEAKVGTGMVFGAGKTWRLGNLYLPVNFAVAQGKAKGEEESSLKLTLITGFALK